MLTANKIALALPSVGNYTGEIVVELSGHLESTLIDFILVAVVWPILGFYQNCDMYVLYHEAQILHQARKHSLQRHYCTSTIGAKRSSSGSSVVLPAQGLAGAVLVLNGYVSARYVAGAACRYHESEASCRS